ncbi:MAG TPA: RidA family protein [Vicinamibacterales bacterium]|nr:RidA family protein [Vicinamibacterales bacterium]
MRVLAALGFLVAATAVVGAQSSRQFITTGGNPSLPFSSAVKAGGFVYVAGAIGDGTTPLAKGDVRAQTRQTLDGIARTLKEAGSSLANAASVTVYLRNVSDAAAMNEVYASYFPTNPPARTTVVVTQPLANADGLVEISMIAIPDGGERTVIHPDGWAKVPSPYSYGIKSGNTLFLAGLVSRSGKDNTNVTGDIATQTRTVLDNGAAILKQAGMSFADVVSARVYLADAAMFQPMNAAYRPYFSDLPPARLTVKAGLPGADYAIEVGLIAVKDATRIAVTTPNADGTAGRPSANLSSAVRVGNTLYLSGIIGNTPATKGDVKAQSTEILNRVERTLKAGGFTMADIVDATVFMSDMTRFGDMNEIYRARFGGKFPARATVGIGPVGDDVLLEMMFVAVK